MTVRAAAFGRGTTRRPGPGLKRRVQIQVTRRVVRFGERRIGLRIRLTLTCHKQRRPGRIEAYGQEAERDSVRAVRPRVASSVRNVTETLSHTMLATGLGIARV